MVRRVDKRYRQQNISLLGSKIIDLTLKREPGLNII